MTTKQIAEAAGVSIDTVSRAGRTLFPEKFSQGKRIVYVQSEAIQLMSVLRKKGFVELPQNAEVLPQNAVAGEALDTAFKAALVTLSVMAQNLEARMSKIETRIEQRQALLPAPQVKPRDHISQLVRAYASRNGVEYAAAWGELYTEFAYRTNSNPRLSAKNRNMGIIDYIESEGMIETLEAVAIEVMGRDAA